MAPVVRDLQGRPRSRRRAAAPIARRAPISIARSRMPRMPLEDGQRPGRQTRARRRARVSTTAPSRLAQLQRRRASPRRGARRSSAPPARRGRRRAPARRSAPATRSRRALDRMPRLLARTTSRARPARSAARAPRAPRGAAARAIRRTSSAPVRAVSRSSSSSSRSSSGIVRGEALDLQHHRREGLADLVVQLARDALALGLLHDQRPAGALAPLVLQAVEHLVEGLRERRDSGHRRRPATRSPGSSGSRRRIVSATVRSGRERRAQQHEVQRPASPAARPAARAARSKRDRHGHRDRREDQERRREREHRGVRGEDPPEQRHGGMTAAHDR